MRIVPLVVLAAMSVVWTWPLALHARDHLPGVPGNYSFLWNLWWMRKALAVAELDFFHSDYLLSPFGIDLVTQPHAALQGYLSATALGALTIVEAQNLYIFVSVFLNAACAYALVFDITRGRVLGMLAGVAFGGSPYVAAQLLGHVHLLTAWVMPLFALFLRRALQSGHVGTAIGCGVCAAIAAYSAYDLVVYLALFGIAYTVASRQPFWRSVQALMIAAAVFAVLCLPLIVQAFRVAVSDGYVSQVNLGGRARDIEVLAPVIGNPFHPLGWIGIVPIMVLLTGRGKWLAIEEARRWKIVLIVFAVCALGLTGGAMVGVYLALGVLMALRLAGLENKTRPAYSSGMTTALIVLLALDYFPAPVPLTALDRPAVYEQLGSIQDTGAVIEVPFGTGDGLTLYHATIHGHPVVGGYIGRMPPVLAQAYDAMPIVGNLLRLSNGGRAVESAAPQSLPFRYLVLNTDTASPELVDYVRETFDMDLIASGNGRELYAVQGARPVERRAEMRRHVHSGGVGR